MSEFEIICLLLSLIILLIVAGFSLMLGKIDILRHDIKYRLIEREKNDE